MAFNPLYRTKRASINYDLNTVFLVDTIIDFEDVARIESLDDSTPIKDIENYVFVHFYYSSAVVIKGDFDHFCMMWKKARDLKLNNSIKFTPN